MFCLVPGRSPGILFENKMYQNNRQEFVLLFPSFPRPSVPSNKRLPPDEKSPLPISTINFFGPPSILS